eukprot:CAMPEP_0197740880 /NCGR_PEP_ID=MMETSP1435-20131217/25574_1 /TAXON_ID=426625 /ORGANISM="Chaetoceros brevis, Strain CCMP164" /LENGTH=72 /DNA_ID=CAMNT_0043330735 /DNA_START=166 /DNA_END=381 /DNA_ORIENTATION=-
MKLSMAQPPPAQFSHLPNPIHEYNYLPMSQDENETLGQPDYSPWLLLFGDLTKDWNHQHLRRHMKIYLSIDL